MSSNAPTRRHNTLWMLALPCAIVVNCGPSAGGTHGTDLMSQTAIGANRCAEAAKTHSKPFVIEWDATDLSTFESRAARDMLFVEFKGCELKVLYECSDNSIPGKYGKYAQPQWTSGSTETLAIKSEDDLYAQLPLGVATLGGRVEKGESLSMIYFVSGTATATRDKVFRGEVKDKAECKNATHFVWSYNLGAFEIASASSTKVEANATYAGIGASGEHLREGSQVRKGGSLESCKTQDQRSCRVPIRLVLRALDDGEPPATAPGMPASTAQGNQGPQWNQEAFQIRQTAGQKETAGDGAGCLADLDRADQLDPHPPENIQMMVTQLRANCEMRAGKCENGKRRFRQAMAAVPSNKNLSEKELDTIVDTQARLRCSSANNPTPYLAQIGQASSQRDAASCQSAATALEAMLPNLSGTPIQGEKATALAGLSMAVTCLARGGKCAEADALHKKLYHLQFPTTSETDRRKVFSAVAPDCKAN